MATARSRLASSGLPALDEDPTATNSPARGREMRTNLLSKLRPPPLVHAWDFWHEKPAASSASNPTSATPSTTSEYATTLTHLHAVADVRAFWSLFNNLAFDALPPRHSIHLFHAHVRPVWEDQRNARGGAWTFRVPRAHATAVFQAVCLLAIGEQLQAAVADPRRSTFRDDICGVSFRQRFGAAQVQVWNRDAMHDAGVQRVKDAVLSSLPEGVELGERDFFYKAHAENDGFVRDEPAESAELAATEDKSAVVAASVEAMERGLERARQIMADVKASDEAMHQKLASEIAREEEQHGTTHAET